MVIRKMLIKIRRKKKGKLKIDGKTLIYCRSSI
jgi:hypothetical protein